MHARGAVWIAREGAEMVGCVVLTLRHSMELGGLVGHIEIADHVHISSFSLVTRSLLKPGHYTGVFPIDENAAWEKNAASLKQLHSLRDRVRALEKK